jgi:hypothetical protein
MTDGQLEEFAENFNLVAGPVQKDGEDIVLVEERRNCGNCDFFVRVNATNGLCDCYDFKHTRYGYKSEVYFFHSHNVMDGEDCSHHRRRGK